MVKKSGQKKGKKKPDIFLIPSHVRLLFALLHRQCPKLDEKKPGQKKGKKKRVNGAPHFNYTVTLSGVTINDHTNLDDSTQEGRGRTVILGGGVGGGWLHGRV